MRHYEIVLILHPDCTNRLLGIIDYYKDIIINNSGKIHRLENWGRRQLAYSIKKLHKANYVLLNIEVSQNTIDVLKRDFRFNDVIVRSMIIKMKHAMFDPSPMMQKQEEGQERLISPNL